MSNLRALKAERDQRHADCATAFRNLVWTVKVSGPPPAQPADETWSHRAARAAAKAYAERWDLFRAADAAYEREVLELNRSVARHPAGRFRTS